MLLSIYRLMVRGPSSAAVQWKPIDGKNRDPNGNAAKAAALYLQGKVSSSLSAQHIRVVCYLPVAYQSNERDTPQGPEFDKLIKIQIDKNRYVVLHIHVTADQQIQFEGVYPS